MRICCPAHARPRPAPQQPLSPPTLAGWVQTLRRLEALVAGEGSPAADADLVFMTRLLQLAVACRAMLRERAYAFAPASPELLHTFYPLLMAAMVEAELHDADTVDGVPRAALLQHGRKGSAASQCLHANIGA